MDEEIEIPPFVQDYLDKMEYEGFDEFSKLAGKYQKERQDYPDKFGKQSAFLKDFEKESGKTYQLSYEDGLNKIDERYKKEAYKIAKQHGYKGIDPFAPSDAEFTKQGDKFISMIEQNRQPVNELEASNNPKDLEKQRVAFLEKIKETKSKITQRQKD